MICMFLCLCRNYNPQEGCTHKKCKMCGEIKVFSELHKNSKAFHGVSSLCKKCKAKRVRKTRHDLNLKRNFGMSKEDYEKIEEEQNHCCKICNVHKSTLKKRLVVDHCHITGIVRGLLCDKCNVGIGKLNDNPEILLKAFDYLKKEKIYNFTYQITASGKKVNK